MSGSTGSEKPRSYISCRPGCDAALLSAFHPRTHSAQSPRRAKQASSRARNKATRACQMTGCGAMAALMGSVGRGVCLSGLPDVTTGARRTCHLGLLWARRSRRCPFGPVSGDAPGRGEVTDRRPAPEAWPRSPNEGPGARSIACAMLQPFGSAWSSRTQSELRETQSYQVGRQEGTRCFGVRAGCRTRSPERNTLLRSRPMLIRPTTGTAGE